MIYQKKKLIRSNLPFLLTSNLKLFFSKNKFYSDYFKIINDIYDIKIIKTSLTIIVNLLCSDFTICKIQYFIKFFNLDFIQNLKQIYDYFYSLYNSKINELSRWNILEKYIILLPQGQFQTILHHINYIFQTLMDIFDEYILSFVDKKTKRDSKFSFDKLSFPEKTENKIYLLNNTVFPKSEQKTQSNTQENNDYFINYSNFENIQLKTSDIFTLSNYIIENYNFTEISNLCENIIAECNLKIVELFELNSGNFQNNIILKKQIKDVLIYLQNPQQKANFHVNFIKIENITNCSILQIKQDIKNLYNEDYDLYYYSKNNNLFIKLTTSEDIVQACLEEKIHMMKNHIYKSELEIHLDLQLSESEEKKNQLHLMCINCEKDFIIMEEELIIYNTNGSKFYRICTDCRGILFNKFLEVTDMPNNTIITNDILLNNSRTKTFTNSSVKNQNFLNSKIGKSNFSNSVSKNFSKPQIFNNLSEGKGINKDYSLLSLKKNNDFKNINLNSDDKGNNINKNIIFPRFPPNNNNSLNKNTLNLSRLNDISAFEISQLNDIHNNEENIIFSNISLNKLPNNNKNFKN